MLIGKLEALAERCLKNEHYQHKGLSKDQILPMAARAFKRIPKEQAEKVINSWSRFCRENGVVESINDLIFYRFLAQTNLFFLCHLLEKYDKVTEKTHEDICNQFFVQKNPADYKMFEDFANSLDGIDLKKRLLLVPRGGFKSSIDIADCVQWIISFSEVTILILTGVYGLAKDFVGELTGHFTLEEVGQDAKGHPKYGPKKLIDETKSAFQVLFAEHMITPKDVRDTEFQTPASLLRDKEPTVMAASIEQNLSGWHFGIMKLDDVVTNENSGTITRLEAVNHQVDVNRAMLHPYGFFDLIGTWYDESDVYGLCIKNEERFAEEEGLQHAVQGSVFEGYFNSNVTMKIYLRSAWIPTPEAKKLGKIDSEMKEEDYILWFPERLPYKFLALEKRTSPEGFAIKYENNPRKVHQVKFPRELLLRRTIPANAVPQTGLIVSAVDTAYSVKNWADYTVMVTALIYGGCFYIIDVLRGRYNEFELPAVLAATGYKWKPKRIAIEDSVGVRWFSRELRREMDKLQISIPVEYVSLGLGTKAKSKELKAKPVVRLLGDERMFFSNICSGLDELYKELENFGTASGTHDDVVSALSILVDQFGGYADMNSRINLANTQYIADQRSKNRHDLIYGLGQFSRHNSNFQIDDNPVTTFQLENSKTETFADIDPFEDLLN
jgi:phage terminase large subunit-like protein